MLGFPLHQSGAELREDGEVEAGVAQLKAQDVLPVYARTDGFGGLPIRKPF
jgi:hypothetical protein